MKLFEIVDDMLHATAFPTDNLLKTSINVIQTTKNLSFQGSLKVVKFNNDIFLQAIDQQGVILGYVKIDKLYNIKTNLIIDGTFTEDKSNNKPVDNSPKLLN